MTEAKPSGKRIAAIFTDGVEPVEFTEPAKALRNAGAEVSVLSIAAGKVRGVFVMDWIDRYEVISGKLGLFVDDCIVSYE